MRSAAGALLGVLTAVTRIGLENGAAFQRRLCGFRAPPNQPRTVDAIVPDPWSSAKN